MLHQPKHSKGSANEDIGGVKTETVKEDQTWCSAEVGGVSKREKNAVKN